MPKSPLNCFCVHLRRRTYLLFRTQDISKVNIQMISFSRLWQQVILALMVDFPSLEGQQRSYFLHWWVLVQSVVLKTMFDLIKHSGTYVFFFKALWHILIMRSLLSFDRITISNLQHRSWLLKTYTTIPGRFDTFIEVGQGISSDYNHWILE